MSSISMSFPPTHRGPPVQPSREATVPTVWADFYEETHLQAVIVETALINTAKQTSNPLPVAFDLLTLAWSHAYSRRASVRREPETA